MILKSSSRVYFLLFFMCVFLSFLSVSFCLYSLSIVLFPFSVVSICVFYRFSLWLPSFLSYYLRFLLIHLRLLSFYLCFISFRFLSCLSAFSIVFLCGYIVLSAFSTVLSPVSVCVCFLSFCPFSIFLSAFPVVFICVFYRFIPVFCIFFVFYRLICVSCRFIRVF